MDDDMEDYEMNANSTTIDRVKEGVDDVVEKTREAVNGGLDAAKDRLASVAGRLDKTYRKTAKELQNRAIAARDTLEDARDTLVAGYGRASRKVVRLDRKARRLISEHPRKAVLLAAGVGILTALIWSRARRASAESA